MAKKIKKKLSSKGEFVSQGGTHVLFINVRSPDQLRYLPMVLAASAIRELDLFLRFSPGVRAWSPVWSPTSDVRSGSVRVIPHASMDSRLANSDPGFMDRAWVI